MPLVSQAQSRYMHAHENDKGELGKVAREFTAATPKGYVKRLPERVAQAVLGGFVLTHARHDRPVDGVAVPTVEHGERGAITTLHALDDRTLFIQRDDGRSTVDVRYGLRQPELRG